MKLLADVNVSPLVVQQLQRRGYDAVRVTEFDDNAIRIHRLPVEL